MDLKIAKKVIPYTTNTKRSNSIIKPKEQAYNWRLLQHRSTHVTTTLLFRTH